MSGPTLRILLGGATSLGPGKIALLEEIARHGSIAAAARSMGMSYRQAWLLVAAMNKAFRQPLVEKVTGGPGGGGARLTDLGCEVLRRYRAMEDKARQAIAAELQDFGHLLARGGATKRR